MSMGMGWGSPQGQKKGPGTLYLETQRGEGRGEESINLPATAKVNPGSWRLFPFAFIPQGEPSLRTSSQEEGATSLLKSGRGSFRTEPVSQKGTDLGD